MHIMEYSAINRNKLFINATWMNLKIMLTEGSQAKKKKKCYKIFENINYL